MASQGQVTMEPEYRIFRKPLYAHEANGPGGALVLDDNANIPYQVRATAPHCGRVSTGTMALYPPTSSWSTTPWATRGSSYLTSDDGTSTAVPWVEFHAGDNDGVEFSYTVEVPTPPHLAAWEGMWASFEGEGEVGQGDAVLDPAGARGHTHLQELTQVAVVATPMDSEGSTTSLVFRVRPSRLSSVRFYHVAVYASVWR
jgi:hypothetical protein